MTEIWQPTTEPLVLHVIPTALARGAQREARALADQLDAPGWRAHRLLTIFDGPVEVRPDLSLHADGGRAPAVGYDPRVVPKLRSALKRLDPAMVVAHGSDPLKYLVPALAGTRRPLAYYAIGTYAGSREHRLQLRMWQRLVARADVVAAEGNEVKLECSELLGVPPAKVTMTPNGRDPEEFRPRPPPVVANPPMVTFVGALTDGKRPDRFIEVVAELRQRGLPFDAQLVGDGPLGPSLTRPAARAGVELLGSRSDVADILGRSDVMVFPSRAAGEGMPGVLIEAGLSGVPVVATDVPGVTTIVADGETGLVVAPDDPLAMVEATARLLGDDGLRRDMAGAARNRCVERFSLEAVAGTWLGLLAPLLPVGSVPAG
jgi:glycosyltransferase involved in cell wall biosynthesis